MQIPALLGSAERMSELRSNSALDNLVEAGQVALACTGVTLANDRHEFGGPHTELKLDALQA